MIKKIGEILKEKKSFLIVSHKDPDGDAIGSSLALFNVLKEMNKNVFVENPTALPNLYSFLEDYDKIQMVGNKKDVEVIIAVDSADLGRCGIKRTYAENKIFINIDHHGTNTKFGDINLVVPDASAVGCILWEIFTKNSIEISKNTADCLYVSILTDTGSFRYLSTTPKTFRIAAHLLEKGVDPWFISYNIYESRRLSTLKLLGLTLNTLDVFHNGKLSIEYVSRDMLKKTYAGIEATEGFVNFARSVRGAEVAVLIREDAPYKCKVSIRSKDKVDVSSIALSFGGGGHKNASGFEIEGTIDSVKEKIVNAFSFLSE